MQEKNRKYPLKSVKYAKKHCTINMKKKYGFYIYEYFLNNLNKNLHSVG